MLQNWRHLQKGSLVKNTIERQGGHMEVFRSIPEYTIVEEFYSVTWHVSLSKQIVIGATIRNTRQKIDASQWQNQLRKMKNLSSP